MISCTLGDKTYTIEYVKGRALREIEPALKAYQSIADLADKAVKGEDTTTSLTIKDTIDVMLKWFCILFDNQFTADEFLDNYPADRVMHDLALALMSVQSQVTNVLSEFPTKGQTQTIAKKILKNRKA